MKKPIYILAFVLIAASATAQQFPFLEGYNINPFSLSPAYAGLENADYLFSDYRTDWSGIDGGPATYQFSYSTKATEKVGVGARIILDKADIFRQTLVMGTYSYQVNVVEGHSVTLAISAGAFRNSIDLAKYFNDPGFVPDAALISGSVKSRFKFASDLSALYRHGHIEGGIVFSNLMFGSAHYNNSDVSYKPLNNFLVHASYSHMLNEVLAVKPVILVRGGQNIPAYYEFAPQAIYNDMVWCSLSYRTGGVWGMGLGAEIIDGIMINYSYNLSSGVAMSIFGGHQLSLGVRLVDLPFVEQ